MYINKEKVVFSNFITMSVYINVYIVQNQKKELLKQNDGEKLLLSFSFLVPISKKNIQCISTNRVSHFVVLIKDKLNYPKLKVKFVEIRSL